MPQVERRLHTDPETSIIAAALAAGVPYPHGCRSGRCGACKSRVIEGTVALGAHSPFALTPDEREDGLILACRAVPTSNVTVEWLDRTGPLAAQLRQQATVVANDRMTHDIVRLRIRLQDRQNFRFAAGQYLSLKIQGCPDRFYSMASRPDEELIEHVRAIGGGRTSMAATILKPGDRVEIVGPSGTSYLRDAHDGPILAVAGGSGLAPVKSIIETALRSGKTAPIHLYFGVRSDRDLYLTDSFAALADQHGNLVFIPVVQDGSAAGLKSGFVTDAIALDDVATHGSKAYVAGPPPMVDAAMKLLRRYGIPTSDIHADVFFTPEAG